MRVSAAKLAAGVASAALSLLTVATVAAPVPAIGSTPAAAIVETPRTNTLWSPAAIADLQAEALASAREGLDPTAYDLASLSMASARGDTAEIDRAATALALTLAGDYLHGRIDARGRQDWHIERPDADPALLANGLRAALAAGRVRGWLRDQLPTDARYAALRAAYATTPEGDTAMRDRVRVNMERWRWMPRNLGSDHIYVNVPSYTLAVVDDGRPVSTYTVVVGARSTPTPQIAVAAQSVVVNPWWNVPQSIARTLTPSAAKGYVVSGKSIRQKPGPSNALGKVKIDMPNPHAIYLHDTPAKALFAKESRALSHGCIRVKDIDKLAEELVALDSGDGRALESALAGATTRTVALGRARPVYLVYFTAEAGADGKLVSYEDPYGRDAGLAKKLGQSDRVASRDVAARQGA
ncbi:L,D-transpeptidase family protein [Allosphingosinicella indica]|uniref:L,D-transpeptidase catalytic domain n=1 Tax=Allosphingosinicella indica TaxID=941907 RepID=A0A1X7GRB3_9SPHN|nr:L,D-transpeptidase family protein [Allosphingosinicella indica]SMF73414.1 L,D-transpeptidase catalytic domain [Allosphingosinicella indica]